MALYFLCHLDQLLTIYASPCLAFHITLVPALTPRYNTRLINLVVLYLLEFDMSLTTADTAQIVKTYRREKDDTGSPEVQIALITARIDYLTKHLKVHTHDVHTRYGLTNLVSQRRKLMTYLKRVKPQVYRDLIKKLDIRG